MKLLKWLQQPVQYLVKGVAKIFTPTDDYVLAFTNLLNFIIFFKLCLT